ncbi:unnamed protein product [Sphagnum troendelagicum]|uniref:GAGA-binding transcriptional activator n=1 Tax=Sphagnum troendelagicum TaxID=128251 RepID=A0ABP0UBC3_9BRYO
MHPIDPHHPVLRISHSVSLPPIKTPRAPPPPPPPLHEKNKNHDPLKPLAQKKSPQVSPGVPAQNKALHLAVKKVESWPSPIQRQLQEYQVKGDEEEGQTRESEIASTASYATMPVSAPTRIPYCSCTGMNQQCYRWGSGGWQSACCTTLLSLHPLPMNPKKRGSRVAGRKMSAGAFDKLLEKLKLEGVDVSYSVDLKDHWAKHGTNRYVTLR